MAQGIASAFRERCGSRWLRRESRGVTQQTEFSGFTLVELLVVIGVIAIVAALLLPVFSRAKAQAQSVKCKSNLHQIGLALQMYLSDFRRYPVGWDIPLTVSYQGETLESGSLTRYLSQQRKVFFCPMQEDCPLRLWFPMGGDDRVSGYALNQSGTANSTQFMDLHLGLGTGVPPEEVGEGKIQFPADMIAYGDCFTGALQLSPHGTNRWDENNDAVGVPSSRHLGGANLLFCDGHVEFEKQADWIIATDRARSRWNNDHLPHLETW